MKTSSKNRIVFVILAIILLLSCINGQRRLITTTYRTISSTQRGSFIQRITTETPPPYSNEDRNTDSPPAYETLYSEHGRISNRDKDRPCNSLSQGEDAPKVFYNRSSKPNAKPPIFLNNTHIELVVSVQELIFICNASYPIEWVFSTPLGTEWSIREGRDSISVNYTRNAYTREIYTAELSYKPPPSTKSTKITCRSVQHTKCLQSTVSVHRNTAQRNQTLSIIINHNEPKGIYVPQYTRVAGTNSDCSIKLEYNKETKSFICSSKYQQNLTVNVAETVTSTNCYDPFSCGTLYTRPNKTKCNEIYHEKESIEIETQTFPLDNGYSHTGVILCKPDGKPEEISATMHFFYSLPQICPSESSFPDDYSHLYVDVVPSSVPSHEFLSICPSQFDVYKGDIIPVQCVSSLYYFADGMRIKVKRKNGTVQTLASKLDSKPGDAKERGYRMYTADVKINDTDISAIECEAPIRKTSSWTSKESSVNVLQPIPITFDGGHLAVTIKYSPSSEIRCEARGIPRPTLSWSQNDRPLSPELKTVGNETLGWIGIIIPEQNSSAYYGAYSCKAENRVEFKTKAFILQAPDVEESSNWQIWGPLLAIGIILVVALVAFLIWKINEQTKKLQLLSKAEIEEFMNGRPEILTSQRSSTDYDVNSYAACLPYNKNYEVLKEQLEIDANAVLGSGAYGMVLKGFLTLRTGERIKVAIKTVKPMDEISYFKALMSELKIMGYIGKHENIVNLLGANTKSIQNREIFIAIEYCQNGSLLNYLRDHRLGFDNYVHEGVLQPNINRVSYCTPSQVLSTLNLLKWGLQIANGMDFLYHKKVIHGDMAARNILVSHNLVAKIGDFGLSRQLFEYANYIKKHQSPLPWKWLAVECLQDMKFSSKSDVWAYGITLWEIFSLGQSPYPGMSYNEEFMDSLLEGRRPLRPQNAHKELYDIMKKCWKIDPNERPSFLEISQFFDETIRSIIPQQYVELQDENFLRVERNDIGGRLAVNKSDRVVRFMSNGSRVGLD